MKFIYAIVVLALIAGGYFFITLQQRDNQIEPESTVPEGFHVMSDGTVMSDTVQMEEPPAPDTLSPAAVDQDAKVFAVKGTNYTFDVKEIKVKKGDTVTIQFESMDGFHDWTVDEFDAATERVQPGTPTSVTFVADTAGSFEYYCSVGEHRLHGMVGTLIVEE